MLLRLFLSVIVACAWILESAMAGGNGMVDDPENTIYLELEHGRVVIDLRPDLAPNHVARIKELAREKFYDGVVFHRVRRKRGAFEGFMAQTGDPTGTGTGGSDKPDLDAEFSDQPHVRGTLSMARSADPNSALVFRNLIQQSVLHRLQGGGPATSTVNTASGARWSTAWSTSTRSNGATAATAWSIDETWTKIPTRSSPCASLRTWESSSRSDPGGVRPTVKLDLL